MAPTDTLTFDSHNPVTNEVITSHENFNELAVRAAVDRARSASQEWRELGFRGRRKVLLKWSADLLSKYRCPCRISLARNRKANERCKT
jgi:acyl-CoA reductase-like NAD-dependent aldehyde dehydrogenase